MKATIRDPETLQSIEPNQVATYLQMNGWQQESFLPDKASIWTLGSEPESQFEVLLPLNPKFRDFPIRMSEVLKTLEAVEHRSQIEILTSLVGSVADIIDIRLTHPSFEDGTMPLHDGVHLIRHARDLLLSVASSTVEPKAHFERTRPPRASRYVEKVRLGQTKRGSYVLSIVSPLSPMQLSLDSSEPFERAVVKKLFKSLETTKHVAEEIASSSRHDLLVSNNEIQQGISANLCAALMGIHNSGKQQGLEINLNWASAIGVPEDVGTQIIFPSRIMPSVARLGRRLKAHVYENFEVRGEVIKLERQRKDATGSVTLLSRVDDRERKIKVELAETDYRLASIANQERRVVICRGNLIKEGRIFTLAYPQGLSLA
ncbi:hypothetical protein [Alkalinema sp. FACHB-956]|uniref:hypothetical protein n=1 Tax=Alkalinema sp. FACHB-956 TaxID=2692768 RepID=UPI00168564FB|nr:hypothetical protein [Alkalinema sp. FACHB-956]MBD2327837.1 hypothetical protein [Alkalinema sp. FACHB-956]